MAEIQESPTPAAVLARAALSDAAWSNFIPEEQWTVLKEGTETIDQVGAPLLLAGSLGQAAYTGHWRNTKDIDVIIHSTDRERVVEALRRAGFEDYFEREAYDRSWIFRGFKSGVLFDVIWALPNHRVAIDEPWFERSRTFCLHGRTYLAAPVEELIRIKLYVMQRDRCDWVDVLNLLGATVEEIAWPWLVERMGRDLPLLHAVLAIFNWMCPGRAHAVPAWLRKQFALSRVETDDFRVTEERRVRVFDSRPWFALHQPDGQPLER
jgi:hypothetical protein